MMIRSILILIPLFIVSFQQLHSQHFIAAIMPDICSPGMNVYMEIFSKASEKGSFGTDGFFLNNASDNVRVYPLHDKDTNVIVFSPFQVSWEGRLISIHAFVKDQQFGGPNPNSDDWSLLQNEFRIPIVVSVNGTITNADTVYIVKPFNFGDKSKEPQVNIFGEGTWGKRSRRGAMIVNSIILPPNSLNTVSTKDCDPYLPGNQGYLPFILISKDSVIGNNSIISVNASNQHGGPGGGGGAGTFCDFDIFLTNSKDGGNGYSGGAPGGNNSTRRYKNAGIGTLNSTSASIGGYSITGIPGGECRAYEGGGGGTGHPFGSSGSGSYGTSGLIAGGHGGGSSPTNNEAGGGGGNRTPGVADKGNEGLSIGNPAITPMSGGSGGAAGNPLSDCSGSGGGGGGGIKVYGSRINNILFTAKGSDGEGNSPNGGSGSGGNILLNSRTKIDIKNIDISPGGGRYSGGYGRFRFDSPVFPDTVPLLFPYSNNVNNDSYRGPTTQDLQKASRAQITKLAYSGGDTIQFYIKGLHTDWILYNSAPKVPSKFGDSVQLNFNDPIQFPDSIYFLIAVQKQNSSYSSKNEFLQEPEFILSQAAANILYAPMIPIIASANKDTVQTRIQCPEDIIQDSIRLYNLGSADLRIDSMSFLNRSHGFSIISPKPPFYIKPKDSVILTYTVSNNISVGYFTDTLQVYNNDPSFGKSPWLISLTAEKLINEIDIESDSYDEIQKIILPITCINVGYDTTFVVYNNSQSMLNNSHIRLINNTSNDFTLTPIVSNIVSLEKRTLFLRYTPKDTSTDTCYVVIKNPICALYDTLIVTGKGKQTILSSQTNFISFPQTSAFYSSQQSFTVYNTGDTKAYIPAINFIDPPFSLQSSIPTLPAFINPGDSLICTITFSPTSENTFRDTLYVQSTTQLPSCPASISIPMEGKSVLPSITISLPSDTIVQPKEELYSLPIYMKSSDTTIVDFTLSFSTNPLLFYPKSATKGNLTNFINAVGKREITIEINKEKYTPSDSVLTIIQGIIQLDSIEKDSLHWISRKWHANIMAKDVYNDGYLDLSLCEVGGKRLLHNIANNKTKLLLIPNPASQNQGQLLQIQYPIERIGTYKLQLCNQQGKLVKEFQDKMVSINDIGRNQIISINTDDLPTGVYSVILTNGNILVTDKLYVIH